MIHTNSQVIHIFADMEKTNRTCKTCKYAHFRTDPETGATLWTGRCFAKMLNGDGHTFRYHHIEQHFKCSNNMYTPR